MSDAPSAPWRPVHEGPVGQVRPYSSTAAGRPGNQTERRARASVLSRSRPRCPPRGAAGTSCSTVSRSVPAAECTGGRPEDHGDSDRSALCAVRKNEEKRRQGARIVRRVGGGRRRGSQRRRPRAELGVGWQGREERRRSRRARRGVHPPMAAVGTGVAKAAAGRGCGGRGELVPAVRIIAARAARRAEAVEDSESRQRLRVRVA